MLRKGLAFLVMSALCASTAAAADGKPNRAPSTQSGGLLGWIKDKAGNTESAPSPIQRAVVDDAERQSAHVRQTVQRPDEPIDVTEGEFVEVAPPIPITQRPVVPNTSPTAGPQYFSSSNGNGFTNPVPVTPGNNWQTWSEPLPVQAGTPAPFRPVSSSVPAHLMHPAAFVQDDNGSDSQPQQATINTPGMYPQTGAALYPAPKPGIPYQVGGTVIPHPAFQPHEMLYPHHYKAMYPPYYYKVNGGWWVSPFGVWSHEKWTLQGTQVDVKYRSHISPFALFKAPNIR